MVSRTIGHNADQGTRPGRETVLSGAVPPLAEHFFPRPESGLESGDRLRPGEVTVLADVPGSGPAGSGGTGKTQLAAGLAHAVRLGQAAHLIVWADAARRDSVLTGYAQALADLGLAAPGGEPEADAARLLTYLASSSNPWLVVLDDVGDHQALDGLWPAGPAGQVVVTAPFAGPVLNALAQPGGLAAGPEVPAAAGRLPRSVQTGPFTRREAVNFLTSAFRSDPDLRLGAPDLAAELGCLPMALGHACAVMLDGRLDCREYLQAYHDRHRRLTSSVPDIAAQTGCPVEIIVAWSLAVDRAIQASPGGVAWPVLALAACLDPAGFPGAVLTSPAAVAYLTRGPGPGGAGPADAAQIREAVGALTRAGLMTVDPADDARTVRVHALVQNLVRSFVPAAQRDQDARAAADALAQAWPAAETGLLLAQSLRDNAARVGEMAGDLLWDGGCHRLLGLHGDSLARAGLADSAVGFWEAMAGVSRRVLGPEHPDSAAAAARLAQAYRSAGRADAAVPLQEQAFAEQLGALGTEDPRTMNARDDLARSYLAAGRTEDAVSLCRRTVAERQRTGGPDHPDTLAARASLAEAYRAAGRTREAVSECERVLAGRQRAAGPEHPDTLAALGLLALAYRTAGRTRQAIGAYQRTVAGRERVQGPDHPDTLAARANLAAAYHAARRPREAVREYEATLAGRERVQGTDHPDTLIARANLASAYHSAGRLADAIPMYERVIADYGRVMGPDHPDTLTSRSNLAHAYHTVGRLTESVELFQRTLADCEHALGASHPITVALRENLAAVQT